MTSAEQKLLDYLNQQFPETVGRIPLRDKIHEVWKQGMTDAAALCSPDSAWLLAGDIVAKRDQTKSV